MSCPHILIMDSGAGGLSVTAEVRRLIPDAMISYLADLEYFPYGTKSEADIVRRVTGLFARVHVQTEVDIAVIACNTASTVVLDSLRSRFSVPFVGVVPAIKPAAALTVNRSIGVLATEGTITRHYTQQLISQYASHCRVHLKGSRRLVELAELKLQGLAVDMNAVEEELACFRTADGSTVDTVVLACTHFPLIKQELAQALPVVLNWVDSGEAIARRVKHLIGGLSSAKAAAAHAGPNRFLKSGSGPLLYRGHILQEYLGAYDLIPLPGAP